MASINSLSRNVRLALGNNFIRVLKFMKTYRAIDQFGNTIYVSAYTESEARQKAEEELGYGNVIKFEEL